MCRCDGFQLDPSDACNVQYYLFCEALFKPTDGKTRSRCPPPAGYPPHCCYVRALAEEARAEGRSSARRPVRPPQYLLDVFPKRPEQA